MTGGPDLLGTIVAAARRIVEVRREREPAAALEARAAKASPRGKLFEDALGMACPEQGRGAGRVNLIAE